MQPALSASGDLASMTGVPTTGTMRKPTLNYRSLTRLQAAGIHLAASLVGTGVVALLVLFLWYPGELASLSGVVRILLLVVLVDVVLGPVVTFIVFNTAKPELARDLAIVALLQVAALVYGAHTVFVGRPAYLVFNSEQIDLVYATDISDENLERGAASGFSSLPKVGPQLVAAVMPSDPAAAAKIVTQALTGGDDIQYLPEHYRSAESEKARIVAALKPLEGLKSSNPQAADRVDALLQRFSAHSGGVGYLPLKSAGENAVAILARSDAGLLAISRVNSEKK